MGNLLDRNGAARRSSYLHHIQDGQGAQAKVGTGLGVDISTIRGCLEGVRNEDDGGVYFDPSADGRFVRGNLPYSHQTQVGQAEERGDIMPRVVGTTHGPGCPRLNWVRRVTVLSLCLSFFCMGGVRLVGTRQRP